jgi:soluble lytic murein transglycosylase-like protein
MKKILLVLLGFAIGFAIHYLPIYSPRLHRDHPSSIIPFSGNQYIDSLICAKARKYNLDPFLLASLIKVESDFQPLSTSSIGAIGLGQLHPKYILEYLYEPEINLELTCRELTTWMTKFNIHDALAAYNAGYRLEFGRGYEIKVLNLYSELKRNYDRKTLGFAQK